MTFYLMEDSALREIEAIINMPVDPVAFAAFEPKSELSQNAGFDGRITIAGPMEPQTNKRLDFFGVNHTSYADIQRQVSNAVKAGAKELVFDANTPGGTVEGMAATMDAINATGLPVKFLATGKLASAGYQMAAATGAHISAENDLTIIGSNGSMVSVGINPNIVNITNTESPHKYPDAATEKGREIIQSQLSDVYSRVVERMANGRGVTVEHINENYGKGAIMTAKTALAKGMIDSIGFEKDADSKSNSNAGGPANNRSNAMNIEKLKAEQPDVYAQIFELGQAAGKESAIKMAKAHMNLAEGSGDTKRAIEDISKGVNASDPECFSYHQMKAIKNAQITARDDESTVDVGEVEELSAANRAEQYATDELISAANAMRARSEDENV